MKTLQSRLHMIATLALLLCLSSCTNQAQVAELKEAAERGEYAYRQYRTADYAAAKTALLDFVNFLERKIADPSSTLGETAKAEIMIAYARLAKLEERNSGPEREAYMQKSIAMCQQLKVQRKCTALDMEAQIGAIDDVLQVK
ncbi:MAG TPA: hypothetical protein VFR51_13245 [Pyrinomonadaceae bacterium]|nr:hypothetical protein [Pyrinomonadaceae bacterium]